MATKVKSKKAVAKSKNKVITSNGRSAKKPVAARSTGKKPANTKKPAIVARPAKSAPAPKKLEIVPEPEAPARAPVRRIIGSSNQVSQVVQAKPSPQVEVPLALVLPPVQSDVAPARVPKIVPQEVKEPVARKEVVLSPKLTWTSLPKYVPAHIRFLLGMAFKESEQAQSSPFPLAKFISSLPNDICGLQFAILLLSLEHSSERIAELCQADVEFVEATLDNAKANVLQKFTSDCGDMSRKLRTQLSGFGVGVESIMDQYLIAKVDRSFQIMLGSVILKVLTDKAAHPIIRSA
jgi:hypothetical protein